MKRLKQDDLNDITRKSIEARYILLLIKKAERDLMINYPLKESKEIINFLKKYKNKVKKYE